MDSNVPVIVPVNVPVKSTMQEQVFEAVVANPGINRVAIAKRLDVNVRTVGRLVSLLKGRIEFRGAPKTGGYYCIESKRVVRDLARELRGNIV